MIQLIMTQTYIMTWRKFGKCLGRLGEESRLILFSVRLCLIHSHEYTYIACYMFYSFVSAYVGWCCV